MNFLFRTILSEIKNSLSPNPFKIEHSALKAAVYTPTIDLELSTGYPYVCLFHSSTSHFFPMFDHNFYTMNPCLRLLYLFFLLPFCATAQTPYWQQKVNNDISVRLDDSLHFLYGNIDITYFNNSPDSLRFIYFHLYPNAYKNLETAFARQQEANSNLSFYYALPSQRGFIDSLDFHVLDKGKYIPSKIEPTANIDVVKLILPGVLAPGESVGITTPFRVKIPLVFSRLGHKEQSYQISQWFPKPAVYDAQGWHAFPYLDQGEFYSEFGDYTVRITLPDNYIVMGTGNIQEEKENEWLESLARIEIDSVSALAYPATQPSSRTFKTITFKESQVHDFAWFADKSWVVRIDTVANPGNGKIITAYSAFFPSHYKAWSQSMDAIKTTIRGYGSKVGDYPYKTVKVAEGALKAGGGMEYPTVTVIDATDNVNNVRSIIIHEVGHNWFYGILGSNERDFPWMDEGINSFYETKLFQAPPSYKNPANASDNQVGVSVFGAAHSLFPATTASEDLPYMSYGVDIYAKVPLYLAYLEAYIGSSAFEGAMHRYFDTWKFKHPQPADFEKIFRERSPKNIDWFFNLMNSSDMVDFAVKKVDRNSGGVAVDVRNNTSVALPVAVSLIRHDGTVVQKWSEPFAGTTTLVFEDIADARDVYIDPAIPDGNIKQNSAGRKLALKGFGGINYNKTYNIWLSPFAGFNRYDGFMAGLFFHNVSLPQNKFRFILAPMYGFRSGDIVGHATFNYTQSLLKNGFLDNIDYYLFVKSYGYQRSYLKGFENESLGYFKVAPEVVFNFRKPSYRSSVSSSLSLKGYLISEQQFAYDPAGGSGPRFDRNVNNIYGKVAYRFSNSRVINPYRLTLEGQVGAAFAKISAEGNWDFNYNMKNKAFHLRAYAGKFFRLSDNYFDYSRYQLANTFSGANDYLYDHTFIGRGETTGLWSQQVAIREGGFKFNTLQYSNQIGLNDDYLIALNLKTDIPVKNVPLRLYCDLSTFGGDLLSSDASRFLYNAGVEIHILGYFAIHIPVLMSPQFRDYKKFILGDKFFKTISFSHNLNSINWVRFPNSFLRLN